MYTFRGNIAEKFGINAAVVAEYLYAGERELEYMEPVSYTHLTLPTSASV